MATVNLLEHVLRALDEILLPALGAYVIWLLRTWLEKGRKP